MDKFRGFLRSWLAVIVSVVILLGGIVFIGFDTIRSGDSMEAKLFDDASDPLCATDGSEAIPVTKIELNSVERLTYQVIGCVDQESVDQGAEINYRIIVINNGNETLKDITIRPAISNELTYQTGSSKKTQGKDSQEVSDDWIEDGFSAVELAPQKSFTLSYSLKADEDVDEGVLLVNTAEVTTRELPAPKQVTLRTTVGKIDESLAPTPTPAASPSPMQGVESGTPAAPPVIVPVVPPVVQPAASPMAPPFVRPAASPAAEYGRTMHSVPAFSVAPEKPPGHKA